MSETHLGLRKCAAWGCHEYEDPRFGGFCDGHGPTTDEQMRARINEWREGNLHVFRLVEAAKALAQEVACGQFCVEHCQPSLNNHGPKCPDAGIWNAIQLLEASYG